MAATFPNLVKRRRLWVARLPVPKDAQEAIGKSLLSWSTGEEDPVRAAIRARPILAGWKEQIAAARRGDVARDSLPPDEVTRLRALARSASRYEDSGVTFEDEATNTLKTLLPVALRGQPFDDAVTAAVNGGRIPGQCGGVKAGHSFAA